jgi:hypothetical protein
VCLSHGTARESPRHGDVPQEQHLEQAAGLTPSAPHKHNKNTLKSYPTGLAVSQLVSDYGVEDREMRVRTPAGEKGFLASVSRPALGPTQLPVQWVPGVISPGIKYGRGVSLTTHPHLVPRSRMSRSYTASPPCASMACSGTAFFMKGMLQTGHVARVGKMVTCS